MFDTLIINPFINLLLLFYSLLGQNVFLALVAFTVVVRLALTPLSLAQLRSAKEMQKIQPLLRDLQDKYKTDREMLVQKQMELYREHKINPFTGCFMVLIQMPILLGLWQAIVTTLALSPGDLIRLSDRIFLNSLEHLVPLNHQFLWLNLAVPDPYLILPVLVVITTWFQQRLLTPPAPKRKPGEPEDPAEQAAVISRQMMTIMPLMFGFFALTFSSGLSIYFIISNLIGVIQYSMMGTADFRRLFGGAAPEEDAALMTSDGRKRKSGISDSHWSEGKGLKPAVESAAAQPAPSDKASSQRKTKPKANRAKTKTK